MDKLPDLADCQRTLWTRSSAEIVGNARRLYSFRKRVEVVKVGRKSCPILRSATRTRILSKKKPSEIDLLHIEIASLFGKKAPAVLLKPKRRCRRPEKWTEDVQSPLFKTRDHEPGGCF